MARAKKKAAADAPAPIATITTTRRALLDGLSLAARVTPKKSPQEALMRLTLAYREHELSAFACDLFVSVETHLQGECDAPFDLCVQGRDIYDVVRRCPEGEGEVTLEVRPTNLTICAGASSWTLPTTHTDDAPAPIVLPDTVAVKSLDADAGLLAELLGAVRPHIGDGSHAHLNCVLVERSNGRLRAVATNGHSLAVAEDAAGEGDDLHVVLPAPTVELLARMLPGNGSTTLKVGRRTAELMLGPSRVGLLLADDAFPPYLKVIPAKLPHSFNVRRGELLDEVTRVALVGMDRMLLRCSEGRMDLHCVDPSTARQSFGAVDCGHHGEPVDYGVSPLYLRDALAACAHDDVTLGLGDPNRDPITLRAKAETRESTVVVMPMRL